MKTNQHNFLKKCIACAAILLLLLCVLPLAVSAAEGTPIASADELMALMKDSSKWSGKYYLSSDIDLGSKSGQAPIGNADVKFTGVFDGNGKTVSGLFLDGSKYQALFGYAENAVIKNLTVRGKVEDTTTAGNEMYTAGVVGALGGSSTLENVTSYVDVRALGTNSTQAVGGLVGKLGITADGGTITIKNCHTYGNVQAARGVGSFIGILSAGGIEKTTGTFTGGKIAISGCTAAGEVVYSSGSNYAQAGGMIGNVFGYMADGFEIRFTDCVNEASLNGATPKARAGGMIGWISCDKKDCTNNRAGGTIILENCENRGSVTASSDCGGVLGYVTMLYRTDYEIRMTRCVNSGSITATGNGVGGVVGATKGGVFTLKECANYGSINADQQKAGGVVGYADTASTTGALRVSLADCTNRGTVTAFATLGGVIASGTAPITIERCFNAGKLVCVDLTGIKAAISASVTGDLSVKDTYFLDSEMDLNAQSVTKADAADPASFTGWDFSGVWAVEDGLPVLKFLAGKSPAVTPDTEKETEKTTEPAESETEKAAESSSEKTTEKSTEKATEKVTEKATDTAAKGTEPVSGDNDGMSATTILWIVVGAVAVAAAAAIAILLVLKKKKQA